MRRAARVDANQAAIVAALQAAGCAVQSLAPIGKGCPDLLVRLPGGRGLALIEVKDGAKRPSARALTPDQVRWHEQWGARVYVVESVVQALQVVGAQNGDIA